MFADLKAVFGLEDRDHLWNTIKKKGINQHLINKIKEIYLERST